MSASTCILHSCVCVCVHVYSSLLRLCLRPRVFFTLAYVSASTSILHSCVCVCVHVYSSLLRLCLRPRVFFTLAVCVCVHVYSSLLRLCLRPRVFTHGCGSALTLFVFRLGFFGVPGPWGGGGGNLEKIWKVKNKLL